MGWQSGIASASAASAVAQRYREADSIQVQRAASKSREFASAFPSEPSVVASISKNALAASPPPRLAPETAVQAKPVMRSALPSPALAKRGSAAYSTAASAFGAASDAEAPVRTESRLSIEC